MESIYKIKIRSNPSTELYPSERRYSSSIVLGLSIMLLTLGVTSSLMGTLLIRRLSANTTLLFENYTEPDARLVQRVEEDLQLPPIPHRPINIPAVISAGVFMMALGLLLAGCTGLLAWKQWYVDNNITWFFLSSCLSTITSSISLMVLALAVVDLWGKILLIGVGLMGNILIGSLMGVILSSIATSVGFKGMKNRYPDDLVLGKKPKGRLEVCTERKGNKIGRVVAPDILNHFPKNGKIAKFLSKEDSREGLPKAESNREYEERVKKFLEGE